MKHKTILVVAAHPDDEILGCGGTIARQVKNGAKCHILILGEGVTSRDDLRETKARSLEIEELKRQAKKASAIVGTSSLEILSFPDNRLDSIDLLDIIKSVERAVERIRPEVIFTHHFGDLNIDHQITARAVETACRPFSKWKVKEVYAFEIPSSTGWLLSNHHSQFHPNCYFDISDTLDIKIEAFKAYASEVRTFPHPRSPESLIHNAKVRGSQSGLDAAETFCLIRKIN